MVGVGVGEVFTMPFHPQIYLWGKWRLNLMTLSGTDGSQTTTETENGGVMVLSGSCGLLGQRFGVLGLQPGRHLGDAGAVEQTLQGIGPQCGASIPHLPAQALGGHLAAKASQGRWQCQCGHIGFLKKGGRALVPT